MIEHRCEAGGNMKSIQGSIPASARGRRLVALGLALALAGLVSGCESAGSSIPNPGVVFPDGPPTSSLETDPFALAVRESQEQLTLAFIYADYSDPKLIQAVGYTQAVMLAYHDGERRTFDPGSRLILASHYASLGAVVDITVAPGGDFAVVHTCMPESAAALADGYFAPLNWFVRKNDDGTYVAWPNDFLKPDYTQCIDYEPVAYEWAAPINIDAINPKWVKQPAPREYYVGLGVIDE